MRRWLLLAAILLVAAGPRSGHDDASPAVQAMQDDDAQNPAMLWVQQGQSLWDEGCTGCHGPVARLRGVAARYPVVEAGRVVTLGARVNQCRTERMHEAPWGGESDALLGVTALIGLQSRGMPVAVEAEGALLEQGRALFNQRMGQLNLSCAQCHDGLAGRRLGGSTIPQGQPNGYPLYRLEWQSMGSLDRRLRNCMTGVRAEVLPADGADIGALKLYLGWRSRGLVMETPAVRP